MPHPPPFPLPFLSVALHYLTVEMTIHTFLMSFLLYVFVWFVFPTVLSLKVAPTILETFNTEFTESMNE